MSYLQPNADPEDSGTPAFEPKTPVVKATDKRSSKDPNEVLLDSGQLDDEDEDDGFAD